MEHTDLDYSKESLISSSDMAEMVETKNKNKADLESNRYLLEEDDNTSCVKKLSNQTVLGVTCLMFFLFVVAEIIGAVVSLVFMIGNFANFTNGCVVRPVIRYHCWVMPQL